MDGWYDMLWHDYDMRWYTMICDDMIWHALVWYGMVWCGTGMVWYHMKCRGMCFFCSRWIPFYPPVAMDHCRSGISRWRHHTSRDARGGWLGNDETNEPHFNWCCTVGSYYLILYIYNYITCFSLAPSTTKQGSGNNGFPVPACLLCKIIFECTMTMENCHHGRCTWDDWLPSKLVGGT